MSVPKSERNESSVEFFANAIKIRKVIKQEMQDNFGLKVNASEAVRELYKAYGLYQAYNSDYTTFELATMRMEIKKVMRKIIAELSNANSIYVTIREEYTERRLHWDRALGYCDELLQLLQELTEELPINSNRLMPAVSLICLEKKLIKGVRKSDNRFLKKFN